MNTALISIDLEFARTETPEDPYAFRFGPQSYTLRTAQGGRKRVQLNWTDELLADLEALRAPKCDAAVIQRVAHVLCSFLQPAGWTYWAQEILKASHEHQPVYFTVRSSAAELYILPWELLSMEGTGQCIGELNHLLVRYEWPDTQTVPETHGPAADDGKILVAWSAAGGPIPAAEHISVLDEAFRPGDPAYCSHHQVLPNASVTRLANALEQAQNEGAPVKVLHLLSHGGKLGETTGLLLDDDSGRSEPVGVDAWRLRHLLAPYASTLRLVVVLACESAQAGRFDSVAQALHRSGIHAVIASRFLMSVAGSIQFSRVFYQDLLLHRSSISQAFLRGRTHLARQAARLDWASLQLYVRAEDTPADLLATPPPVSSASLPFYDETTRRERTAQGLGLNELISERKQLDEKASRYESSLALVHAEIVDFVALFAQLGPSAARGLQARYRELFRECAEPQTGRIFEGEGQHFLQACFPNVESALKANLSFLEAICNYNFQAARENQLIVRVGVHHGTVLTDGQLVYGDEVDFTQTIAAHAGASEIQLSYPAFLQAPRVVRTMCRALAIIGHLDLAWTYSFQELTSTFDSHRHRRFQGMVQSILRGRRTGLAFADLRRVQGMVQTDLTHAADRTAAENLPASEAEQIRLGHRWMLHHDLQGYVLLGDPATRLRVTPSRRREDPVRPMHAVSTPALTPSLSTPVPLEDMEAAVHAMIAGDLPLKALERQYRVDRATLKIWEESYLRAGRQALAGLQGRIR